MNYSFNFVDTNYTPTNTFGFNDNVTLLSFNFGYGSKLNSDILTYPNISANYYYGVETSTILTSYKIIDGNFYYGSDSNTNLATSLKPIDFNFQYLYITNTDFNFDVLYENLDIKLQSFYGVESNNSLSTFKYISVDIGYGLESNTNLLTFINLGQIDSYYGFEFNIQNYVAELIFDFGYGIESNLLLTPTFIFNYDYGFESNTNLEIIQNILSNFYYGIESNLLLSTYERFNSYYGIESNFNLTINPQKELSFDCRFGLESNCNIIIIPITYFNFDFSHGLESRINIKRPNTSNIELKGYYGLEANTYFKDDVGKGITNIDLDINSCCYPNNIKPSIHETWHIELDNAEYYDTHYWQRDKSIFKIDLSARHRLSFNGYYGSEFKLIENSFLLIQENKKLELNYGINSNTTFFNDDRIKLCKGNFIPDSENVNIELADTLLEDCSIIPFFYGLESNFTLSTKLKINKQFYYGVQLNYGLDIFPKPPEPPEPQYDMFHGIQSSLTLFTEFKLSFNFGYGLESKIHGFKEPNFSGYYGFDSTFQLQEILDVEILDSGDLLNEYRYMDENGDEIKEKFTKTVVELYPYQHWINARCVKPINQ